MLIRNNTSVPFITSDNPVAIHYLEKNKELTKAFDLMMNNQKVTGFNDNDKFQYGISYLCPLSPTVAACFYERKYLENNNMSNFLELDNKITSCVEKFVRGANGLIYNQANS
ncbi:DUF4238 domain-containing protein [Paenibacillus sp. DMB5]|uniref:DUF4238 domain-containing protein n=1 Tax=Paenibacillus sp. DMB5 TaxID=1780103 RepID=UPI0018E3546F|nr:DUF4238 domain-containing protein [Paenibacillus sp. DMB5]